MLNLSSNLFAHSMKPFRFIHRTCSGSAWQLEAIHFVLRLSCAFPLRASQPFPSLSRIPNIPRGQSMPSITARDSEGRKHSSFVYNLNPASDIIQLQRFAFKSNAAK